MNKLENQFDKDGYKEGYWKLFYYDNDNFNSSGESAIFDIANPKVFSDGIFEKGLKQGMWKEYLTSGALKLEEHYHKGVLRGLSKHYFDGIESLQKEIIYIS